jgi:hypothetical protein
VRRIPQHVRQFYNVDKISFSLKTRSNDVAAKRAIKLAHQLDEQWFSMGIHQHAAFSRYVINRSVDVRSRNDKGICDDPVVILSEDGQSLHLQQKNNIF